MAKEGKPLLLKTIAPLAVAMSIFATGCQHRQADSLQFEPRPRAVIPPSAFFSSHSGRVGVDWVSSPTVHLLAVVGENDGARLALFNSEDGGDTFQSPVWISENGKRVTSNGENSPAFFVSQDDMFAAWNEGHELRFARSFTWGSRFETLYRPVVIPAGSSTASMPLDSGPVRWRGSAVRRAPATIN
jgi:hypothetical protein